MQATFEVAKDPKVAFELMAPVYWDPVRQHATAFSPGAVLIGRAKFTSCVNDTKLDVVAVGSVCVEPQNDKPHKADVSSVYVALDDAKRAFDRSMQQMQDLKHERDRLKSQVSALQANISRVSFERDEEKASLKASENRWRDVMQTLSKRNEECDGLRRELEATRAELATIRNDYEKATIAIDEVFQPTGSYAAILPDFVRPGESKFAAVKMLAFDFRDAKAELAKLRAEREPRDNGDGTVTALRPVTYPKGLPIKCVRDPKIGDEFISDIGEHITCAMPPKGGGRVRLILRPAQQPLEPVMWRAALPNGEYVATSVGYSAGEWPVSWATAKIQLNIDKPARPGRYLFKDGVGTLVEYSDE